jgi:hypothetical protein
MFSDPLTITLIIAVTLVLGIILWVFFFRKPFILFILTLLIFVLNVILEPKIISFEIGNYNINILDILSIFLLTNAIGRLIVIPQKRQIEFFIIFFLGILLFTSWLRGSFIYGLEISTNSIRTYFYFYVILFYTCTFEFSLTFSDNVFSWIKITSFFIITITIVRWTMVIFSEVSTTTWIAPNGNMVRVLSAPATLILLQFFFILSYTRKSKKKNIFIIPALIAILAMILVLQQRTVWVALITSLFILILLKSKLKNLVILGLMFLIVVVMFILISNNFSIENLTGTALDFSNLNWRIQGWQSLLTPERFHTPLEILIGQPFGSGYGRYILNSVYETTVSPHNFYIQTLLNIGSFGLILLIFLYGIILYHLINVQNNSISRLFIILLSSQLVFYLTYAPSFEQGLILGLAIIFLRSTPNSRGKVSDAIEESQIPRKANKKKIPNQN